MNMTKSARQKRYQEYLQLKSLPFLSEKQAKRFHKLQKQRAIDNHYAFQCRKVS